MKNCMRDIYNEKKKIVGFVDRGVYYTKRNYALNQIYILKYDNGIGISDYVYKQLRALGVKKIICTLKNTPNPKRLHYSVYISCSDFWEFKKIDQEKMRRFKDSPNNLLVLGRVFVVELDKWKVVT